MNSNNHQPQKKGSHWNVNGITDVSSATHSSLPKANETIWKLWSSKQTCMCTKVVYRSPEYSSGKKSL